ncbi:unnamed protein product, partial [Symbiodinium pilosum]
RKLVELAKLQLPGLLPRRNFPDDGRQRLTPLRRRPVHRRCFEVQQDSAVEAAWSPEELALTFPVSASTGGLNNLAQHRVGYIEGLLRVLNPDVQCLSRVDP